MEASDILAQAKSSNDVPHGWIVFPLSRSKVAAGIAGWFFGIVVGLGLFALMASVVVPYNYQHGSLAAVVTSLFLALLLFIGFGSLWALIVDVERLREANTHIIVLTPDDFVKQEGKKITHVPLMYVRHVTARGRPRAESDTGYNSIPSAGENLGGFLFGRNNTSSGIRRRKRMRTPTSLAFIDTRTDDEVIVVTDQSYGDPYMIASLLKQYAASVQRIA